MNNTISGKQLQEFLINLGFKSPDLVDLADDRLKPILLDSIEYQKLIDRMISANGKLDSDKQTTICFSPIVIIIAIWEWFFRIRKQAVNAFDIALALLGTVLIVYFVIRWIVHYLRYKIASKATERYVNKWVERVEANQVSFEGLMCLNNKIQSCESILRQKGTRSVETPPEQIVEYILITKGDAENLLAEYYQKIEDFKMNWVIKSYLVRNPFIYSLIYLYRPKSLQAFMNACYEEYLNNPETFDTDDVEKLFDRYIATG